jgi:hypothetical protein
VKNLTGYCLASGGLALAQSVGRRVDRVVAEDEIMLVRSGRAENEFGIGQRFEFDRFTRRLEGRELPMPQFVRRGQDARGRGTIVKLRIVGHGPFFFQGMTALFSIDRYCP